MNRRSSKESRRKIIDAAMEVFSKRGYPKANMRDIASIAGISIGGVYLYFRNKEDLYECLIREKLRDVTAMTELISGDEKSPAEELERFLRLHLGYAHKHREFILLHIREHGFTFGMNEKRQFFTKQTETIERIISRGTRSGEFRKCNPRETAKIIMGSLRGIVLSMALDNVIVAPRFLVEFVLKGLLKV